MSTIALRRVSRRLSWRAVVDALLRAQQPAVAASALFRNQHVACASVPVRFASERMPRSRWLA